MYSIADGKKERLYAMCIEQGLRSAVYNKINNPIYNPINNPINGDAGASMLSAAAAIGVRDSGVAWRLTGETSQEMFKRWQGISQDYAPRARNLLLPPVPAAYAGVRELAVQGLIELVTKPDTKLLRALSLAEATTMRAAEAAGTRMAKAFARPLVNKERTAAEWAAVLVRHVEHGSYELTDCVPWTAGSSTTAVRLADTAVVGGLHGCWPGGLHGC